MKIWTEELLKLMSLPRDKNVMDSKTTTEVVIVVATTEEVMTVVVTTEVVMTVVVTTEVAMTVVAVSLFFYKFEIIIF